MIDIRILNGNPMTFIASLNGKDVGKLSVTILPLVHDMDVDESLVSHAIAEALRRAAALKVEEAEFDEALVLVEEGNLPMKRWVESTKAVKEPPSNAYMMAVR